LNHVNYIDLHYSYLGIPRNYFLHRCQNILQEILRVEYKHKNEVYRSEQMKKLIRNSVQRNENISSSDKLYNTINPIIRSNSQKENTPKITTTPKQNLMTQTDGRFFRE
jgi:hypothetical protein